MAVDRRHFLAGAAAGAAGVAIGSSGARGAARVAGGWQATHDYLASLARPDGGYGWDDQPRSHLTPTFAVIGCLSVLDLEPDDPERLAQFVLTHHPRELKRLEQEHRMFDYQQVMSLLWLGADPGPLKPQVAKWKRPLAYLRQYERHGYPVFAQEVSAILCWRLLGMPVEELPREFIDYLDERRRADGSFNNTPAADGSGGNVINTWWGLHALDGLGRADENREAAREWIRACQLPGGGFTHQPRAEWAAVDDVAYTWAAVRSLALLGASPEYTAGCVDYIHSLRNEDGGFGDRPGWPSNPMATFYALDALSALQQVDVSPPPARHRPPRPSLPADLKVFSIQLEAHGQGSPREAVALARALRIHLWGAKNAQPQWLARAQQLADAEQTPVTFFASNEEYGTWVDFPGMGTYSHTSDIIAPAGADIGPSLAGRSALTWEEFRRRRLGPLAAAGGRLIWQFGENEPLVRLLLDDSLQRTGFAAISTFHFGNPDFTNSEPFLKRYRMQIPFVALQDAHGSEPWWFADMTEGFRTLFLAKEPTWEEWLRALQNRWVVAVRHDEVSGGETWMHGSSPEVLDVVQQHASDWQWWDNPAIRRPLVSLVLLGPEDTLEEGRPEQGRALRIRCAWKNSAHGQPKQPMCELVALEVDGQRVEPQRVARRRRDGLYDDYYHLYALAATGKRHRAVATVRHLSTGNEHRQELTFVA